MLYLCTYLDASIIIILQKLDEVVSTGSILRDEILMDLNGSKAPFSQGEFHS